MKVFFYLTFCLFFFGSSIEGEEGYVGRLTRFNGTPYNVLNCSGFICAAHKHEHCSAKEMWEACGNSLKVIQQAAGRDGINYSTLRAGDVAAFHGVHVAAYVGNGVWMDSDPAHGGVAKFRLEKTNPLDPWFAGEIKILRWR
jgi:hypothetical protein